MPLAERLLISRIHAASRRASKTALGSTRLSKTGKPRVIAGIGDDCAVFRFSQDRDLVLTTDFSLEGVHFRREWHSPESAGHRCLARGLSDIAAMGAEPDLVFLSLGLPGDLPQQWADGFLSGLLKLAERFRVSLAGGDTAESPAGIFADIVVVGSLPKGKAVLRSGAKPGDRIYVTGALGESAAAVERLYSATGKVEFDRFPRHFFPLPRVRQARFLSARKIPSAMIDISDGLSTDLGHICQQSGAGAEIWESAIPRAKLPGRKERVRAELALHGGEDYELLFTARPRLRVPRLVLGVPVTCIGEITRRRKMLLVGENGARSVLGPAGWEYFG
ncbi:MAG: thiamine-phosphate kinase [Acidobacteria bacterium]|nr:thiamine-phosphate kinase [Acidobacteriota bacterium]